MYPLTNPNITNRISSEFSFQLFKKLTAKTRRQFVITDL